jgi:hypothetical protein
MVKRRLSHDQRGEHLEGIEHVLPPEHRQGHRHGEHRQACGLPGNQSGEHRWTGRDSHGASEEEAQEEAICL